MMGKDSTTSQLDFLLLEEVSNEAAEAISGGQELTLGGTQSLKLGLFDPITMPIDVLTKIFGSIGTLTESFGALGLPDIASLAGGLGGIQLPAGLPTLPTTM